MYKALDLVCHLKKLLAHLITQSQDNFVRMTVSKTNAVARVFTPTIVPLPETESSQSVILEPYHVDLLPEYEYISREYLISGVAYGEPYCTRLLLRCPEDASRFTGFVVVEPSHLWGGTSIWRHTSRWLMRNGDVKHFRQFHFEPY